MLLHAVFPRFTCLAVGKVHTRTYGDIRGHTGTQQAAGLVISDARATGESAGNARMSGVSCAGRAGRVWQAGRAKQARQQDSRTSVARIARCSICLFKIVRFANTSCVKITLSRACKGASLRCARPAGYSRKMSICYLIRCHIDTKTRKKRIFCSIYCIDAYILLPLYRKMYHYASTQEKAVRPDFYKP